MSTITWICPLCRYPVIFGGNAAITLHARVSHGGGTPIVEVTPVNSCHPSCTTPGICDKGKGVHEDQLRRREIFEYKVMGIPE
jgi:hypothetical protein